MSMQELRETFFQECEDLLEAMDGGLRAFEATDSDAETVNMVFRAVHSIKGGAGAFGLDPLVQFAHGFETTLDGLRSGKIALDPGLTKVLMQAGDHLADLVAAAREDGAGDEATSTRLIDALEAASGGPQAEEAIDFAPLALSLDLDFGADLAPPSVDAVADDMAGEVAGPGAASGEAGFLIRFRPDATLYSNGNDTALLFRDLTELGRLESELDASALPDFADFDWRRNYLSWTLRLSTDRDEDAVREVFDFVEGLCDLEIEPIPAGTGGAMPPPGLADPVAGPGPEAEIQRAAEPDTAGTTPAGPGLAGTAASPATDARAARGDADQRRAQKPNPKPGPKPSPKPAAPAASATSAGGPARPRPTIRVDLDRVDRLINVVGELVINQAMLTQAIESAGLGGVGSDIGMGLDELKQLSREIQEGVMAIRAQPVKPLFDRMHRIVRECGEASGKTARLLTEGEATEVDKTVVEKLADPLTHMIRNAVDHGLETAEDRVAAGKPAEGTVVLSAQHRSGRVIITLTDDGGGINRPRVQQIATEKGLIPADAELTPAEIDNLLFLPGFSTAKELSKLSGRGVGLDVVRSAITELGGRVTIQSTPGQGTSFSISLPLTLAVLDGMIVKIGEEQLVIPITAIVETLRPGPGDIQSLGPLDRVIAVRGAYVPIVDVGLSLGFRGPIAALDEAVIVLVEGDQDSRVALAIDAIHDQRQVVIKSLEGNYGQVQGIAAATVLGDGRIALIIDTNSLAGPANALPLIAAE